MNLPPTTYHLPPSRGYNLQPNHGFSLVETILYIGIAVVILLAVSSLIVSSLQSRVKNQTISEVEDQGAQIMQLINQAIRNAQGINSPATGTIATTLSLKSSVPAQDPTIFDLVSNTLRITEDGASPVNLTDPTVIASGLSFYNLSRPGTRGVIRVEFVLTHLNPGNRNEYDYSQKFSGSATLR